jgi:hypothetical protein
MVTGNAKILQALMSTKKISKDKRARAVHLLKDQKAPKKTTKKEKEAQEEVLAQRAEIQ